MEEFTIHGSHQTFILLPIHEHAKEAERGSKNLFYSLIFIEK